MDSFASWNRKVNRLSLGRMGALRRIVGSSSWEIGSLSVQEIQEGECQGFSMQALEVEDTFGQVSQGQ